MELVLVLPIFLLLLFSILEFTFLVTARTRISDAAHVATRQLCLSNVSSDDVRQNVSRMLGDHLSHKATVEITIPERAGQLANVRILVPMRNATPDLLWMTGFSVNGRVLVADAPMIREHDSVR